MDEPMNMDENFEDVEESEDDELDAAGMHIEGEEDDSMPIEEDER